MQISYQEFTVHKRFPLTISRGTTSASTNIWVCLQADEIEGWGEASPFSTILGQGIEAEQILQELQSLAPILEAFHPLERQKIEEILHETQVCSPVRAAIDVALYDWLGKRCGLPLWKMWGLERDRIVPISVTVGINTPENAQKRVQDWQKLMGAKVLKIKLGNPLGIEADQIMFTAIREVAPTAKLTVDANGGWSLKDAIKMCEWLANQGVKYVEQPLPVGEEKNLPILYKKSPLSIFVDESCWTSHDIIRLANCVHGINIKLMKAGGLTEVIRMIHVAKAWNLQVMYGCYSDSSLSNTAMSHLAPLADYLDLDSHLNLSDDPFQGSRLEAGRLLPTDLSGLGVQKIA
jgi:L-alanine-DL-glutamate epimerase-like enolase superfamily enzyme